jgi:CubicO group peptidase (beta-lactamase class C family)
MHIRVILALCLALAAGVDAQEASTTDPHPKTLDEFKAAVQKVLDDTGVPGAGIALVRLDGVEWAGGVGMADREAKTPVTAETHFRAGSISKTFVAIALVQLYEDGDINLDTPVNELVPEMEIDNAWELSDQVTVIHLLEHTAGFDDMHFNEMYNVADPPDIPLADVLRISPSSRVVRWKPGTRMSYSNPAYGLAGYVLEKVTGEKFEDRIAERIFTPTGMETSSFYLKPEDHALLAKGYRDRTGPAVPYTPIYLRPAGNLHTSPADMGKFVHLLLNWGETADDLVVDPEYLSNMEHPRTTLASRAGLQNGYGAAFYSSTVDGFPMLGHNGGIEGFVSTFAYSTSRDVGYVVMLNATHSQEALRRISQLAVRYLKAGVEPPAKPDTDVPAAVLREYEGYYQDAAPRNQAMAFVQWLLSGRTITVDGNRLRARGVFGGEATLIPVSNNLFRLEDDAEASRAFATDEAGTMVLASGMSYEERRPRWRVEIVRWPVLISSALVVTPLLMLIPWLGHARRAEPAGFWWLKAWLLCCAFGFLAPVVGIMNVHDTALGTRNLWTSAMFLGTILLPAAAILSVLFTIDAIIKDAGRWLRAYAITVIVAALVVSGYLSAWGMIGFRPWNF